MNTYLVTYQVEYSTGILIFNANNKEELISFKDYKEISDCCPTITELNTTHKGLVFREE